MEIGTRGPGGFAHHAGGSAREHPVLAQTPEIQVRKLDPGGPTKLPHVGWSPLRETKSALFRDLPVEPFVYFVHSYAFIASNEEDVVARAIYGRPFVAAVSRANMLGLQFHPERSGPIGLQILGSFCRWRP